MRKMSRGEGPHFVPYFATFFHFESAAGGDGLPLALGGRVGADGALRGEAPARGLRQPRRGGLAWG